MSDFQACGLTWVAGFKKRSFLAPIGDTFIQISNPYNAGTAKWYVECSGANISRFLEEPLGLSAEDAAPIAFMLCRDRVKALNQAFEDALKQEGKDGG